MTKRKQFICEHAVFKIDIKAVLPWKIFSLLYETLDYIDLSHLSGQHGAEGEDAPGPDGGVALHQVPQDGRADIYRTKINKNNCRNCLRRRLSHFIIM